jgi:hypothetical protein
MLIKATELQSRVLSSIGTKYEDGMKKSMNESRQRCTNTLNRANELEYDLKSMSENFKKLSSRLDELENTVGLYSGKDRLIS